MHHKGNCNLCWNFKYSLKYLYCPQLQIVNVNSNIKTNETKDDIHNEINNNRIILSPKKNRSRMRREATLRTLFKASPLIRGRESIKNVATWHFTHYTHFCKRSAERAREAGGKSHEITGTAFKMINGCGRFSKNYKKPRVYSCH